MNKTKTRENRFDSECLKTQNDAINNRISLEFNKHNWLLRKLRNQSSINKTSDIKKNKNKSFKYKKSTKKSLRVKTDPMNFYKEQDSTAMNKTSYSEATNPNKAVPVHPSYPTIVQDTTKQNVKRDLNQTKRNITDSQISRARYKSDDISIFPLCDTPKPIKHNLPINIQPDKKSYMTYKPNTLKDTLSSTNLQTGGSMSSDNLFKIPEIPALPTYHRTVLSGENARPEYMRNPEMVQNIAFKKNTEATAQPNDKPINLSNDNSKHRQKPSAVESDNNFDEQIKKYEETLKTILELSKKSKNLITETYISVIGKFLNQLQENSEINRSRLLKIAKTISEILQSIADTLTSALQIMIYSNKSAQTGWIPDLMEIENHCANSTVLGNIPAKQNAVSNETIDVNNDFDLLQRQQENQRNYQVYHNQHLSNNACVGKTNVLNRENKTLKDFRSGHGTFQTRNQNPYLNSTQNVVSDISTQPSPQYGNMHLQRNYQQNYNKMDSIQFQQYRNFNSQDVEQRYERSVSSEFSKTNMNDGINRNNMPRNVDMELDTSDGQNQREYLRHQMTNEIESQKRKSSHASDDPTISFGSSKLIKYNTTAASELPKRQRYEDMLTKEMLSTHKKPTDVLPKKDISNDILEITEIPTENIVTLEGDTVKVTYECYNLDDDEGKCLTINEDPINTLLALSQRNKSILMKNYASQISEMDKQTQKYAEESDMENATNLITLAFNGIMDQLGKLLITNNSQLQKQINHKHTQTAMQIEPKLVNNKPTTNITNTNTTVQNPVNNLAFNENENMNIPHVQHPREMHDHQTNYQMIQQGRNTSNPNLLNPNQGQVRQHKSISNVSDAPLLNQMDPLFNRPQRPQMIADPRFIRPQMTEDPRFNRLQMTEEPQFNRPQVAEDTRFNRSQMAEDPRFNRLQMTENPLFNRTQMTVPMEHQSAYVSTQNAQTLPLSVQHRTLQYANSNKHWNYDHDNRSRINHDQTQINHIQQYQNQMMMHQQNIEQQRYYYQMELQRNGWASQMGNYPRNDWT